MVDPKILPTGGSAAKKQPSRRSGVDALAAGAARASGERAKRRRTPLLVDPSPVDPSPGDPSDDGVRSRPALSSVDGNGAVRAHRPRPVPTSRPLPTAKAKRGSGTYPRQEPRRAKRSAFATVAVTPPSAGGSTSAGAAGVSAAPITAPFSHAKAGSGLDELLRMAIATMRSAAEIAGLSGDDVERRVAATLAFVRRRLTGDFTVDEYGFDEDFAEHIYLPLLRPLYKSWFRVEVRGIENIPSSGGALVVANHSGTVAFDALMTQLAVHDEHPARRHLRVLAADLVFQAPFIGEVARKGGSTLAANPDAERLLASGELVGVWPEGFKGVGKPFSERYKLQRFGRGGFVSAALRTGAPIVPCSIVGAEEIYPILGNLKTLARLAGAPYVPVTPTFPLLGPLGLIPLPSKWIIEFGAPVDTAVLGPQAADDPMLVFDLTDQVRETIQQTLYALLMQRRSVFF
ncbi:MAG TPA: lysophospholipid acyltransferase family protein [Dermatophilaceae bacterium]|nr:lysophospholipid acyltransferase family protein [Dermatophilaceae bacterium]